MTYSFTLSGRLLYHVGQELETIPCSTWERKAAVLVASAQNEVGTAVARTTAMEGGMIFASSASPDSRAELVSAGAAMAMLARRRVARDLYCILTVGGSICLGYKMKICKMDVKMGYL